MREYLTVTQRQRLVELSAPESEINAAFATKPERNLFFKEKEKLYAEQSRSHIFELLDKTHRTMMQDTEETLSDWLMSKRGFTKVTTPTIITADMLSRMTIDNEHSLTKQVFWLEGKRCLRPMLAPNLYELMGRLRKITSQPVRIFECGSCFRKESQGAKHLNEFTMLNLVELAGVEDGDQMNRLKELAHAAMAVLGIINYELVTESSAVYDETLDITVNGQELASGAHGPHPLDDNWQISDPWIGIGFGVERIVMAKFELNHIKSVGRSLGYLDGARLNI